jgi:hypothetical protein
MAQGAAEHSIAFGVDFDDQRKMEAVDDDRGSCSVVRMDVLSVFSQTGRRQVFAKVLSTIEQKFMEDEPNTGRMGEEHEAEVIGRRPQMISSKRSTHARETRHEPYLLFHERRPRALPPELSEHQRAVSTVSPR